MKKKNHFVILTFALLTAVFFSCQDHQNTTNAATAEAANPTAATAQTAKPVATSTPAQRSAPKPGEGIQWISWNEAVAAQAEAPKLLFVDVYTDWCGWCKVMDQKTFSDPGVADYINEHFYAVKFNAEKEDALTFRDQEYKVVAGGRRGIHTLAYALLDGQLSYPSYVYLNENFERMHISKGFKPVDPFMTEMKAVRGDSAQ